MARLWQSSIRNSYGAGPEGGAAPHPHLRDAESDRIADLASDSLAQCVVHRSRLLLTSGFECRLEIGELPRGKVRRSERKQFGLLKVYMSKVEPVRTAGHSHESDVACLARELLGQQLMSQVPYAPFSGYVRYLKAVDTPFNSGAACMIWISWIRCGPGKMEILRSVSNESQFRSDRLVKLRHERGRKESNHPIVSNARRVFGDLC